MLMPSQVLESLDKQLDDLECHRVCLLLEKVSIIAQSMAAVRDKSDEIHNQANEVTQMYMFMHGNLEGLAKLRRSLDAQFRYDLFEAIAETYVATIQVLQNASKVMAPFLSYISAYEENEYSFFLDFKDPVIDESGKPTVVYSTSDHIPDMYYCDGKPDVRNKVMTHQDREDLSVMATSLQSRFFELDEILDGPYYQLVEEVSSNLLVWKEDAENEIDSLQVKQFTHMYHEMCMALDAVEKHSQIIEKKLYANLDEAQKVEKDMDTFFKFYNSLLKIALKYEHLVQTEGDAPDIELLDEPYSA